MDGEGNAEVRHEFAAPNTLPAGLRYNAPQKALQTIAGQTLGRVLSFKNISGNCGQFG
jgi:hypothetical protein